MQLPSDIYIRVRRRPAITPFHTAMPSVVIGKYTRVKSNDRVTHKARGRNRGRGIGCRYKKYFFQLRKSFLLFEYKNEHRVSHKQNYNLQRSFGFWRYAIASKNKLRAVTSGRWRRYTCCRTRAWTRASSLGQCLLLPNYVFNFC